MNHKPPLSQILLLLTDNRGFPGGSVVKNPTGNAGFDQTQFDPWVRKIPWKRKWQTTPVFLPGESLDRGGWRGTVHRVVQSRTRLKWLSTVGNCCVAQGAQLSALWWPRRVGWGYWWEGDPRGRGYIYIHTHTHTHTHIHNYGWFMLLYSRN